jgi:pyruvate carboxylase
MTSLNQQFRKILVANRGEIAIRVLRAASELRIATVAIYTFEDRYSLHRFKADQAFQIGADDDPLKPYLNIKEIIRVAKENQVDAIHPGYGFLSENVGFARACREAGITFIGPDPEIMDQLGDKIAAKDIARKTGIPLIPDSQLDLSTPEIALTEARRIGYPVIIKAAAGGGGRGMRVVRDDDSMAKEYKEASGEALTAFGDGTVFLEKFIERPKHIEVQILGDRHGNVVHLYERDCSIQRRFQKVVEIAPGVSIRKEGTKEKLYAYALQLARAVGYNNAGTVEFLLDDEENVYFIEVNPRIQVEHTVTEEVTGIDLVRSQILVAQGLPLDSPEVGIPNQESIECSGCAIQCRITTEDPTNEFKPDYGTLIAYRSPGGMGIRLDAGSAFAGARISPFFDSLLVKVTAWGRDMPSAARKLHRALREFRVRGVKTNIGFLLNLLENEDFQNQNFTVNFIKENPQLLKSRNWQDSGTRLLRYVADVIVNKNPDVSFRDPNVVLLNPVVPKFNPEEAFPKGSKDKLKELGREGFVNWLKVEPQIQYTDTTFRDAHQSLLATRVRTYDLLKIAESYARHHGSQVFSMEVWGGATFDVALRFLHECPWERLEQIRKAIPNVLLQMLIRGSNAVGYAAYPDNVIERFIEEAAKTGIDIFRIFDSLNYVDSMRTSIRTVRERTESLAEACICYTGDIMDPTRTKFSLQYYLDLARRLEDEGAHILCIKDMAGLLKPFAADVLVRELRQAIDIPIHLHTHDTSSIQVATYLKAVEAGVNVVDLALASMSGLTSQPNFNSFVAMMAGHERENPIPLHTLNEFSNYWESVRRVYHPFESELRAGSADVYEHEIPGGQYSNLRPQARALGLEDKFELVKHNYRVANDLFGDIVKVTPSSKVVGDMALFMTSNNLSAEDVIKRGNSLAFPDSVKALMRGDLGQVEGGFPADVQAVVLKGEKPYTDAPNAHMTPLDLNVEFAAFQEKFGLNTKFRDFLSYQMYPKVYEEYHESSQKYGDLSHLSSKVFFFGMEPMEEIIIELAKGKNIVVKYLNKTQPDELGNRVVFFQLNGQSRMLSVRDKTAKTESIAHQKVSKVSDVGAPLQGSLAKILVKEGDAVQANTPLFVIEAMKMESTIIAHAPGTVKKIHLKEKTLVEQDDLIIELE